MFLLVLAHPACPRQNPESHKTVVVVVVDRYYEICKKKFEMGKQKIWLISRLTEFMHKLKNTAEMQLAITVSG